MQMEVRVPTLGESMTEATVGQWFKSVGDPIAQDETLLELETDKITVSSPANIELLAKGLNPDGGGAEIVYHCTASGGEVFSVGSISYPSSLPVDDSISRITANVLDRFLS